MTTKEIELPENLPLVVVIFTYFLTTLVFFFYTWLIWWIWSIHKNCECIMAAGRNRWHVYFLACSIILSVILFFTRIFYRLPIILHIFSLFLFVFIIVVAKMFVNKIRMGNCNCASNYTTSVIDFTIYINVFVAVVVASIFTFWIFSGRSKI
jgi:hypothetical protein